MSSQEAMTRAEREKSRREEKGMNGVEKKILCGERDCRLGK